MSGDTAFWDAVDALRARRRRYAREAYGFVVAALGETVAGLPPARRADPSARHLTGHELLDGVVALAASEFGPLAPMVFREWAVLSGEDVGEIVFELVHSGQLSARPEDTLEDFRGGPELLGRLAAEAARVPSPRDAPGRPPASPA